jgi:hypothetical protein
MGLFTKNTGNPLYKLNISLVLNDITFSQNSTDTNWIETLINYGEKCKFAKDIFEGYRIVTDRGYLARIKPGQSFDYPIGRKLEEKEAKLNIQENKTALWHLGRVLDGEKEWEGMEKVKLQYSDGSIQFVRSEGKKLYLPLVRERISLKDMTK